MGNRGTTPNWDDEQIAIYGFMEFMDSIARRHRDEGAERKSTLVEQYIDDALSVLGHSSEEDKERLSFAIPEAISFLQMGDTALPNWQETLAKWIYLNWRKRTNQTSLSKDFKSLSVEESLPFHNTVKAIIQVWETRNKP